MGFFKEFLRGKQDKERDNLIERATMTQLGLLPNNLPRIEGYDIHVHSQSAKELSGDYYDFIDDPVNHRLEILNMDVSGKDFPAAITASQLAGAMFILFKNPEMPIDEKLCLLNQLIFERTRRETFVTTMIMRIDYANHVLSFANAGHNPLVICENGSAREEKGIVAPAIGFVDDKKFRNLVKTIEMPIERDVVFLSYTDGITEAMDSKRNEYGVKRVLAHMEKYAGKDVTLLTNALYQDVKRHEAGRPPGDDQTVIIFKRRE